MTHGEGGVGLQVHPDSLSRKRSEIRKCSCLKKALSCKKKKAKGISVM